MSHHRQGRDDLLAELNGQNKATIGAVLGTGSIAKATERADGTMEATIRIPEDALAFEPASVDSLIERTGLNSESIASMLLILELDGHVAPHPGGRYSRMAGQ